MVRRQLPEFEQLTALDKQLLAARYLREASTSIVNSLVARQNPTKEAKGLFGLSVHAFAVHIEPDQSGETLREVARHGLQEAYAAVADADNPRLPALADWLIDQYGFLFKQIAYVHPVADTPPQDPLEIVHRLHEGKLYIQKPA